MEFIVLFMFYLEEIFAGLLFFFLIQQRYSSCPAWGSILKKSAVMQCTMLSSSL